MTLLWLRFLDWLGSAWRYSNKRRKLQKQWGPRWVDYSRKGRTYTRVEFVDEFREPPNGWLPRAEPGWHWNCPNCKTYSLVTESKMPEVLAEWEKLRANAVKGGYRAPARPTMATAPCPECRYRTGDPE